MKKIFFLVFFIFASCLLIGCSAGSPEEEEQLVQALQSLGHSKEDSSEVTLDDVIDAINDKVADDSGETSIVLPWNLLKKILWGEGESPTATTTPMPTATPTPIPTVTPTPMPTATPTPMATPEPIATPTPTATPEPEDDDPLSDGVHLIQRIERFLY